MDLERSASAAADSTILQAQTQAPSGTSHVSSYISPTAISPATVVSPTSAASTPDPLTEVRRPVLPSGSADDEITIRALNNDNVGDAKKLIALFREHYGAQHPFRKVYDTAFWCDSVQSKTEPGGLISMVALDKGRMIAHLGLDHNTETNIVQILLPAVHPEYRGQLFKIARAFWRAIERHAARQEWRMIFEYNLNVQPLLQVLSAKCYASETTALIPCPRVSYGHDAPPGIDGTEGASVILVMCNVLRSDEAPRELYPPAAHRTKVAELFAGIGLHRTFPPIEDAAATCKNAAPSSVNCRKRLAARSLRRFSLYQVRIIPSAIGSHESMLQLLRQIESQRAENDEKLTVQVAMDDPCCPTFCSLLEKDGYRFCGILPLFAGHDYVAYAKFEDAEIRRMTLYTEQSKSLREYMLQHTIAN